MIKLTKKQRAALVAHIDRATRFDGSTLRIDSHGFASARLDANKTFNGHDPMRYVIGDVDAFLADMAEDAMFAAGAAA